MIEDNHHLPPHALTPTAPPGASAGGNGTAAPPPAPAVPATGAKPADKKPAPEPKDSFREIVETVVFVVVLVLLLKTFVAEAFVIPTGSMAETLWGYQKVVECPECRFKFPVNCSSEVEPSDERGRTEVVSCVCPNCRLAIDFTAEYQGRVTWAGGGILRAWDGKSTRPEDVFKDGQREVRPADDVQSFSVAPGTTKVTLDGKAASLDDLPQGASVRVLFRKSDRTATEVAAASSGAAPATPPPLDPGWRSGDRVLVAKFLYDTVMAPERFDVVVFKYPVEPQKNHVPMNYIKRLTGRPGETVAIYYGDLYVCPDLSYEDRNAPGGDRQREQTYTNDEEAVRLFKEQLVERQAAGSGPRYGILRKAPDKMLAMRRIVFDNDHQADDLAGKPRWTPGLDNNHWKVDDPQRPLRFAIAQADGAPATLVYHHLLRDSNKPELVTDFMGYNTGSSRSMPRQNWVGDLMLECQVMVEQSKGELTLDLSKGADRFLARWDLATGVCTLVRKSGDQEETLGSQPTELKKKGTFQIRFANFDERLTVWVDGRLPFGEGVTYEPARQRGPTENDLQPARIGARGVDLSVGQLRLWRDTYYTTARDGNPSNADAEDGDWSVGAEGWHDPTRWGPLRNLPVKTTYVQPGHYLCMGDNSPESSDGRSWGLVPRRLLLGRALLAYYPFTRAGPIR